MLDDETIFIPVRTIEEKVVAKDYDYFLNLGQEVRVIDSFEKYFMQENEVVDIELRNEVAVFKRQLY